MFVRSDVEGRIFLYRVAWWPWRFLGFYSLVSFAFNRDGLCVRQQRVFRWFCGKVVWEDSLHVDAALDSLERLDVLVEWTPFFGGIERYVLSGDGKC